MLQRITNQHEVVTPSQRRRRISCGDAVSVSQHLRHTLVRVQQQQQQHDASRPASSGSHGSLQWHPP